MNSKPLLVFAMKEESRDIFDDCDVLYTGVGKVNAAHSLMRRLNSGVMPSLIINMGTAGSRKHKAGTIINCTSFIQRDMDVSFLGFEKWQTPFSSDPVRIENGLSVDNFTKGVCGTGDNFDISEQAQQFDAVDMEAYALALISLRENIPFLCLKYISDGADDAAGKDWTAALDRAGESLRKVLNDNGF
jgi:adenosylhomocysteine nucleosidase